MHHTKRPHAASQILLALLTSFSILTSSTAGAQALAEPTLSPQPLLPAQRLSIERGAADLGAATEQSLLSTVFYLTSAATLIGGVSSALVLVTELNPWRHHGRGWGTAQLAMLGSAVGSFVVHAVTTVLAIKVGIGAQRRHQRARDALLLTHVSITPFGAVLGGTF